MSWLRGNDQKIAVGVGYFLVAALFFSLGKYSKSNNPPDIRIEEPTVDISEIYNTLKVAGSQSENAATAQVAGDSTELDCTGKIKGNISSSSKIYHMPGGSFYKRTQAEACFDTEEQAKAAGFRKSKR